MAQHDYSIANQSGLAFRQDVNNALAAIVSQNSGATEPSTTYAYMLWADATAGQLKQRNAANNAWVVIGSLGSVGWGLAPLASPSFTGTASFAGDVNMTGTGYLDLPVGTTAQRPGSPSSGMIRFNTSLGQFEGHNGTAWGEFGYAPGTTNFFCKAWVNFNGSGVVAIRASGNVSSITDNGVGDYTVNFTTALADANYAVITGATGAWATSNTARSIGISSTTAPTASAVRIVNIGTGTAEDTAYQQIAIFR